MSADETRHLGGASPEPVRHPRRRSGDDETLQALVASAAVAFVESAYGPDSPEVADVLLDLERAVRRARSAAAKDELKDDRGTLQTDGGSGSAG